MSGALVDLVATGVQDVYLTGKPEVSFFRQSYKRHTNFAMKTVKLDPVGQLVANSEISLKIPSKGDLLSYIWIDLGDVTVSNVSNVAIGADSTSPAIFELWIGGQMVDRQDAYYMTQMWNKFLLDSSAKGHASLRSDLNIYTSPRDKLLGSKWIPLHFFFCDSYGLPLIALQYNEVEIRIKFGNSDPSGYKYYANYVLLDTVERDFFVNKDQEILIDQVQRIDSDGKTSGNVRFDLSLLNHPVKCLLWGRPDNTALTTENVQIYLNGTELFGTPLPDIFFTQVQPYYHSEFGNALLEGDSSDPVNGGSNNKMYSFAMKANKHQPTGTCNFSRLDNADLLINDTTNAETTFYLYGVNFNVLRIKQGMAGLAFAN